MQGQISEDEYYAGINQADDFFGIRPPPPSPEEENATAIEESEEDVVNDLELQFEE